MKSAIWNYPTYKLKELIEKSNTIGEVLTFFNLSNQGSSYASFRKRCERDNLDSSKFNRNLFKKSIVNNVPLKEVMIENSFYHRAMLKKRLIQENIFKNECAECGLEPEWNNKTLVLVLDHINGINNDNRLENLRFLCPNCNSQTPTFCRSKNPRKRERKCRNCAKKIDKKVVYCVECFEEVRKSNLHPGKRKVIWPSKEELSKLLWEKSTSQLAKDFGVSDKAIEKWAKKYGIVKPPRGYWAKLKYSDVPISKEELEKLLWEKPIMHMAKEFNTCERTINKWIKSYGLEKPPIYYWNGKV